MSAAAVIIRRQRQMMRAYREAGATEPQFAVPPESLGFRHSWIFDRMVNRDVFIHVHGGRYFLDEARAQQFEANRRKRALAIVLVAIIIFVIIGLS